MGRLRISYHLAAVDGGATSLQRDLEFPELGPQVGAAMDAQSADGIVRLAELAERQTSAQPPATRNLAH